MQQFEVLEVSDQDRWLELLEQVEQYDCYHLPTYHHLSEISGEGRGVLLAYSSDDLVVLFPLLIRNIEYVIGLESAGQSWYDAVSVYGYAGPIASRKLNQKEKKQLWVHLGEYFNYARLVSIFTSLHPLLGQEYILNGFGDIIPTNPTVSIDLKLSSDEQWRNFRKGHRHDIRKLHRMGYFCIEDKSKQHWDDFINLYYHTMKRLKAPSFYFFPREYFAYIKNYMSDIYRLFLCFDNQKLVNASIYSICQGIIQAHLEGVREEYASMSTGKLMEDAVRLWGNEVGAHTFHLGRGLGGANDSLLYYKKGFSKREHPFNFWRHISNEALYQELVKKLINKTGREPDNSFFPAYRQPVFFQNI